MYCIKNEYHSQSGEFYRKSTDYRQHKSSANTQDELGYKEILHEWCMQLDLGMLTKKKNHFDGFLFLYIYIFRFGSNTNVLCPHFPKNLKIKYNLKNVERFLKIVIYKKKKIVITGKSLQYKSECLGPCSYMKIHFRAFTFCSFSVTCSVTSYVFFP